MVMFFGRRKGYELQSEDAKKFLQKIKDSKVIYCNKHNEEVLVIIHGDNFCRKCLEESGYKLEGMDNFLERV